MQKAWNPDTEKIPLEYRWIVFLYPNTPSDAIKFNTTCVICIIHDVPRPSARKKLRALTSSITYLNRLMDPPRRITRRTFAWIRINLCRRAYVPSRLATSTVDQDKRVERSPENIYTLCDVLCIMLASCIYWPFVVRGLKTLGRKTTFLRWTIWTGLENYPLFDLRVFLLVALVISIAVACVSLCWNYFFQ